MVMAMPQSINSEVTKTNVVKNFLSVKAAFGAGTLAADGVTGDIIMEKSG
jgi:hypothetical protein